MINFTVGPVQSCSEVLEIGSVSTPYFRTAEFSEIMLENEALIKKFMNAPEGSRAVFITGSGTASMEAAVINTLTKDDNALVVKGGSFGERFSQLCDIHGIHHTDIELAPGESLTEDILSQFEGKGYTAFLINVGETSTGVLYDMELVGEFCRRNGIFLIADAISSFIADSLDMEAWGANIVITGSQKALAVPPGISIMAIDKTALDRIEKIESDCLYLDLKTALKNGERGQTPFTPAVTTLLQINARLRAIDSTGFEEEQKKVESLAKYFREKIKDFPFEFLTNTPSNAVTSLKVSNNSAKEIFEILKNEYEIWICPNGGDLAESVFRVGHLGNLTTEDYDKLIDAMHALQERGVF